MRKGNPPSKEESEILPGDFFTGCWELEEWFWPFKPFKMVKTASCEYWTSIKIKISITCGYKEYEIKTKMVQKPWLQLDCNMKFVI